MTENSEKLHKVLANLGYGSRRELERWIEAGRITVNGSRATLGDRVSVGDRIDVDGRRVRGFSSDSAKSRRANKPRVLLYNKPEGEICTRNDPEGRPTVFRRLPRLKGQRWISIGRLDINTSGLLLFTTDGELANKLMHPSSHIDREYAVRIHGSVDDDMIKRMQDGVELEDGFARFTDVQYGRGSGENQWYYVVLMEGRNREVRRLWESQGVKVSRLKRVRFGDVFIPSRVKAGHSCELEALEIESLYIRAGLKNAPPKRRGARATKNRRGR